MGHGNQTPRRKGPGRPAEAAKRGKSVGRGHANGRPKPVGIGHLNKLRWNGQCGHMNAVLTPRGLRERYADVWLPDKDDGARRLDAMMADPVNGHVPMGDIMWGYPARKSGVRESFTRRMLDGEYGGDPDNAFRKMMTAPGERRPVSLEVLRNAVEPERPRPEEPVIVAGGRLVGGGDADRPEDDAGDAAGDTHEEPAEKNAGIRRSCAIGRDELGRLGSVLATVGQLPTTSLKFSVSQRPDDKLDVVFDMNGDIDADVADSMRGLFPHDAVWTQTKDWDE